MLSTAIPVIAVVIGIIASYFVGKAWLDQFAEQIYEKHQFFTRQLIEAGVPQDIAAQDACKLEHVISETSYKKLREAAWPSSREVIPSDE